MSDLGSAIALVSGTTVGAGIIGLASVSEKAGFIPSSLGLLGSWAIMTATGLLIAEVTVNSVKLDGGKTFGIISTTERLLGKQSSVVVGTLYLFIHYALLTAYIGEGGEVLSKELHLPDAAGPLLFTAAAGGVMTFGTNKVIDITNNVCFGLVIASFLGLVGSGAGAVQVQNLAYMDFGAVRAIVPILLLALVFHNVVPSVAAKLRYDKKSIRTAITLGSLLPLTMFVIWDAVVLGLIKDYDAVVHSTVLLDPLELLLSNQPAESRAFSEALVTLFTESALITSFIGFVVGLVEFYSDLLPNKPPRDLSLYCLTLLPPLLLAILDPGVFLSALDIAGTYGISLLFGILPALFTFQLRSQFKTAPSDSRAATSPDLEGTYETYIPGGNAVLYSIISVVCAIVVEKVSI